jgi:hypothetical protein
MNPPDGFLLGMTSPFTTNSQAQSRSWGSSLCLREDACGFTFS